MSHSRQVDNFRPKALLTDIGGVLLTNGWDRHARARAYERFKLDPDETDERHHLVFEVFEHGEMSLDQYLERVVFYSDRPFTLTEFKEFMFDQSQAFPETIDLFKSVKAKHELPILVVSNEGRELQDHRIQRFALSEFVQTFVVSSYVGVRKPDPRIFQIALDLANLQPEDAAYLDDRHVFVEVARSLGIRSECHVSAETTRTVLETWGIAP